MSAGIANALQAIIKDNRQSLQNLYATKGKPASDALAATCVKRMREILREEVSRIRSHTTNEAFLDHIIVESPKFAGDGTFSIAVRFDRTAVERLSIFGRKSVYMPYIVNNQWSYGGGSYRGIDRHGNEIQTITQWIAQEDNGFMQRAVEKFNAEFERRGVKAKLNQDYT
jgi:hypothetical protein